MKDRINQLCNSRIFKGFIVTCLFCLYPKVVFANIMCNDGTVSPSCTDCHQGCCSWHGGCASNYSNYSTSRYTSYYDDDEDYNFLLLNAANATLGPQSFKLGVEEGYVIKAVHFKLDTPNQVNKLTFDSGEWVEEAQHYITNTRYETWCDWTGETQEQIGRASCRERV